MSRVRVACGAVNASVGRRCARRLHNSELLGAYHTAAVLSSAGSVPGPASTCPKLFVNVVSYGPSARGRNCRLSTRAAPASSSRPAVEEEGTGQASDSENDQGTPSAENEGLESESPLHATVADGSSQAKDSIQQASPLLCRIRHIVNRTLSNFDKHLSVAAREADAPPGLPQNIAEAADYLLSLQEPGEVDSTLYFKVAWACGRSGEVQRAYQLLQGSQKLGWEALGFQYYRVLSGFIQRDDLQEAHRLLAQMEALEQTNPAMKVEDYSYVALIKAHGAKMEWGLAVKMLQRMEAHMTARGTGVTVGAYVAAMQACAVAGEKRQVQMLLDRMEAAKPPGLAVGHYAVVAEVFAKRGDLEACQAILDHVDKSTTLTPSIQLLTLLVQSCKQGGHWQDALRFLSRATAADMPEHSLEDQQTLFNEALCVCAEAGYWVGCEKLRDRLQQANLRLLSRTIDAWGQSLVERGQHNQLPELYDSLLAHQHIQPWAARREHAPVQDYPPGFMNLYNLGCYSLQQAAVRRALMDMRAARIKAFKAKEAGEEPATAEESLYSNKHVHNPQEPLIIRLSNKQAALFLRDHLHWACEPPIAAFCHPTEDKKRYGRVILPVTELQKWLSSTAGLRPMASFPKKVQQDSRQKPLPYTTSPKQKAGGMWPH